VIRDKITYHESRIMYYRGQSVPIIYALANQKGGVGKTTTAINLGAYLASLGQRVLLIDIDPQANATSSLGVDKRTVQISTYDLLVRGAPLADVTQLTGQLRLDLAPSAPALAGATVELVNMPQREYRLGLLTVNGLTAAADGVIIPVQCEYLALEGLSQLGRAIDLVRRALHPDLQLRGLVMTMYDTRTTLSRQVVEEVQSHFPGRVFKTIIPRSVRLSEAPSYGEPISSYAPKSSGALAYEMLAQELLQGDGKSQP
jgi:chromosome partitioning protein